MKQALEKRIDAFLSERRKSNGGGWAEITKDDMERLADIIKMLIDHKCEPDADGDVPIEFRLVNRLETNSLQGQPLPYQGFQISGRHGVPVLSKAEKIRHDEDRLELALHNLDIAMREVSLSRDILRLEKSEQET